MLAILGAALHRCRLALRLLHRNLIRQLAYQAIAD